MTLKEILSAMQRTFLKDVTPSKMPKHPNTPVFYTKEQELAMNWEARMIARAMHKIEPHTSVEYRHAKILHEMREKFYANPDASLKKIMNAYQTCISIKDDKEQIKFEANYVNEKVSNYRRLRSHVIGQRN